MNNNTKRLLLDSVNALEELISQTIFSITESANECNRMHTANSYNVTSLSAHLNEYRGERNGIFHTLRTLGYELIFDGEHLADITERKD